MSGYVKYLKSKYFRRIATQIIHSSSIKSSASKAFLSSEITGYCERMCTLLSTWCFSGGHIQSEILLAPRWLTNSLFCSVRALQNRLQISINGLHFIPHCDLANMVLLKTISVNDTHEPWPHLKALDFGLAVKAAGRSPWITTFQQNLRGLSFFYSTHYRAAFILILTVCCLLKT